MSYTYALDELNANIATARIDNDQTGAWNTTMKLIVERMQGRDYDGRTTSRWEIWASENTHVAQSLVQRGDDLHTGVGIDDGPVRMLATFANFLGAAAESYSHEMRTGTKGENSDLFNPHVSSLAHQFSDELAMLASEIEERREQASLLVTYDPALVTPQFLSEHIVELEGVHVVRIEEE